MSHSRSRPSSVNAVAEALLKAHTPHDLASISAVLGIDGKGLSAEQIATNLSAADIDGLAAYAASAGARGVDQHGWMQMSRPPFLTATIISAVVVALLGVIAIPTAVNYDRAATRADRRGRKHIARAVLATLGLLVLLGFMMAFFMLWSEAVPRYGNANKRAKALGTALKKMDLKPSAMQSMCLASVVPGDMMARGFDPMWGPRELVFPFDHGQHWDTAVEWYYFAINLKTDDGTPASLLLLIMRQPTQAPDRLKSYSALEHENNQVWSVTGGMTLGDDRIATMFPSVVSGALPIVTATSQPFVLTVGDIGLTHDTPTVPSDSLFPATLTWVDATTDTRLTLKLTNDAYPKDENLLLQFGTGFTPNALTGTGLGMAYYSYPNVVASGTLSQAGAEMSVGGTAWVDHQWGSMFDADIRIPSWGFRIGANFMRSLTPAAKSDTKSGWHWFALHMEEEDGSRSHWTFALRRGANSTENAALMSDMAGRVFWDRDGTFQDITNVALEVSATAKGTLTDIDFPVAWVLRIRDLPRVVQIVNNTRSDPQDYYYGKPSTFAEAACSLKWAAGATALDLSTSTHGGVGFSETVGYGTFAQNTGACLKALEIPNNDTHLWSSI